MSAGPVSCGATDLPRADAWAVVVAGGRGSRFGAAKQFADLAGRPVLAWSLASARQACAGVVAVLPEADLGSGPWDADRVVAGGATRSASVRAGLAAVPPDVAIIAVHDAARPLVDGSVWASVLAAVAAGADGAIPVTPVTDTVKAITALGTMRTLERASLVAVQTPQAFRASMLRRAHATSGEATDDAALVEAMGGRVDRVAGGSRSMKITDTDDLIVAAALIAHHGWTLPGATCRAASPTPATDRSTT